MIVTNTFFPVQESLLIFTILVAAIFISPFIFRLFRIPDVAAFILVGVIIGPYGFNLLARDSSIELLGTVGLLYIMFLAGLELDLDKLRKNRKSSIVFGLATFLIPFLLGYFVSSYLLELEFQAKLLIAIMFATHTLVAYPIVRKLGINRDISVLTAVGGTIITDTLVLLILSVATQDLASANSGLRIAKLFILVVLYALFVFYTFPKITRWFFRNVKRDRPVHYLFLLFMVCVSSFLAELVGVEPIIGAFLAGLALNKEIPKNSLLMHHIDFVGNVLFIPVFLISIGMLINTRVLLSGTYLWYLSGILILSAFIGKWLAALLAQKLLSFSKAQRNLVFGLTCSHAAATIAIILIGYEKQMIDISVFNATVMVILVSSLAASFITEQSGRKIVLRHELVPENAHVDRILVSIANPATMANLLGVANAFQKVNPAEPVYVVNILTENRSTRENILQIRKELENNVEEFNHLNENVKVITRVDLSASSGIIRAAKEYMASDIVFGWGEQSSASQRIFGSILDHLRNSVQTLFAVRISGKLNSYSTLRVFIPENLEYETAFIPIILKINSLCKAEGCISFYVENTECIDKLNAILPRKNRHEVLLAAAYENIPYEPASIHFHFLLRRESVAYKPKINSEVLKTITSNPAGNYIVVVPGYV